MSKHPIYGLPFLKMAGEQTHESALFLRLVVSVLPNERTNQ